MQSYTFIEAVKALPTNFSEAETEPILKRINPELVGRIRSLFVVLSDDQFRKRVYKTRSKSAPAPVQQVEPSQDEDEPAEDESDVDEDSVPQVEVVSSKPSSKPGTSRNNKRGASSSLSAPAKK